MTDHEKGLVELLSYALCDGNRVDSQGTDNEIVLSDVHNTCYELMARDYDCETLDNSQGQLCSTYPSNIIIPVSSKERKSTSKLSDLVHKCRFARTRGRFAVPVLLLDGKYVCRSSTLARSPEIYCRSGYRYWVQGEAYDTDTNEPSSAQEKLDSSQTNELSISDSSNGNDSYPNGLHPSSEAMPDSNVLRQMSNDSSTEGNKNKEWLLDKMRNADINLLRFLKVDTIFDLMVEKKKVKFGLNVTSSEKVDRQQRYNDFQILSVPYPGCEFFAEYRNCDYKGEGLMFDWKQDFVDADLYVPDNVQNLPKINWHDYINWDLIRLTQNYLKLQLHSLAGTSSTGILLHCISGWDRTPLFVSLVRLSLWADGLVHQSLSPEEMIYFTVAYDWLLFKHQFPDRIAKGEEIFYFCFDFLKYIESEEYSMLKCYQPVNGLKENCETKYSGNSTIGLKPVKYATNGHNGHTDGREVGNVEGESPDAHVQNGVNANSEESQNGFGKSRALPQDVAVMDINDSCYWAPNKANPESEDVLNAENISPGKSCIEMITLTESPYLDDASGPREPVQDPLQYIGELQSKSLIIENSDEVCNKPPSNAGANTTAMLQLSLKGPEVPDEECHLANEVSRRSQNLRKARELILPAYQRAVREHHEREQQNNTGLAATLFNHLSRTLNLVKR